MFTPSWSAEDTNTVPSSLISILTPVSSIILFITFPPAPITSLIFSGSILIIEVLGAYVETSPLGPGIHSLILSKIWSLAFLAPIIASSITLKLNPFILVSTCIDVIPSTVPATLKSISAKKSSIPWISVKTSSLVRSSEVISPIAIPAAGLLRGTPASNNAKVLPQTEACDVEPLELNTSDTNLIVYGNSSSEGINGSNALSAKAPWPISLLPGPLKGFTSPTEYPGKL